MDREPNLSQICTLLVEGFNTDELLELCFGLSAFQPIHSNWSRSGTQKDLARSIVDFANRRLLIEDLLNYIKEHNPRRYDMHKPYFKEPQLASTSVIGAISLNNRGEAFILSDNNLGRGISLEGVYQGISLSIVATSWAEYGMYGCVRSGWSYLPQWTVSHAVAFFKVHTHHDHTGYIHIVDVSNPEHTISLTTRAGTRIAEAFHYKSRPAAKWDFIWQD